MNTGKKPGSLRDSPQHGHDEYRHEIICNSSYILDHACIRERQRATWQRFSNSKTPLNTLPVYRHVQGLISDPQTGSRNPLGPKKCISKQHLILYPENGNTHAISPTSPSSRSIRRVKHARHLFSNVFVCMLAASCNRCCPVL